MDEEEILNLTRSTQNLYDNIVKEILETKNEYVKVNELKNYAHFIVTLIHSLGQQGYVYYVLALNYLLIEKLSPRFGVQRFSQKERNEQNEDYFEYFSNIDNAFKEFSKIDFSSYSKQISEVKKLWEETPPISNIQEETDTAKRHYQILSYYTDYLTCISDFYESFLLLCLFLLILSKLLLGEDVSKYQRDLYNAKKLKYYQLYADRTPKREKKEKLLIDYLVEFHLPEKQRKSLLDFFESIFGDEGIRELRNKRIHHYGEKNMQFVGEKYLEVRYNTGKTRRYSLNEIHGIKINMQLIVYLGFFLVISAFYDMFSQLLELEINEKKHSI